MSSSDIFVKFYVNGARDGMIAALGPELTQTLLVLATFMNGDYECWPTQETLAEHLGITREAVNARIKRLCEFRWNGKEIVTKRRVRSKNGWWNTVYKIEPDSYFAIFNDREAGAENVEKIDYEF